MHVPLKVPLRYHMNDDGLCHQIIGCIILFQKILKPFWKEWQDR